MVAIVLAVVLGVLGLLAAWWLPLSTAWRAPLAVLWLVVASKLVVVAMALRRSRED